MYPQIQNSTHMCRHARFFFLFAIILFSMILGPVGSTKAQEVADVLGSGDRAFAQEKFHDAEKFFTKAVEMESGNYKALRGLADTKIKLGKYVEAEQALDLILKIPTATGRDILVYLPGEQEPREAELVDENVMAVDESGSDAEEMKQFSKFLKSAPLEPVPHYRVNFKKSGRMKLLPKSKTRIQYRGIPTATREQIVSLKTSVRKKIIASVQVKPKEELVAIAGGCFQMGSERGDPDEYPVHEVCLSPFKIGKYEVRQKNFQALMGFNPSQNVGSDLPVEAVTWDDARNYCKKLGLRLPTEAEWEFAARAGTTTAFYWGSTLSGKEANLCDRTCELNIREPRVMDGFKHTAPVGSFPPNPHGLYDMAGNVGEWVQDWMGEFYYRVSDKKDPLGPTPELDACMGVSCIGAQSITHKVYRGGSWNQKAGQLRSANRKDSHFQLKAEGTGFRCAADADSTTTP